MMIGCLLDNSSLLKRRLPQKERSTAFSRDPRILNLELSMAEALYPNPPLAEAPKSRI